MSLKAFHIVFIVSSGLLALGLAVWLLHRYLSATGQSSDLVYGILCLLSAVGLVVYGRYFLKKLKEISYL